MRHSKDSLDTAPRGATGASTDRIEADYILETTLEPRQVATLMAGEQSSGTFVALPAETLELRERVAARVESLDLLEGTTDDPTLNRAKTTLSWPVDSVDTSLPNLMATVAGNLFELNQLSGLRLVDLRLPEPFASAYPGPKFSIEGTRELTGVYDRPIVGTIVKPSVGLSPEATGDLVRELCDAGIDFIKDDELQAGAPLSRFEERARFVMRAINDHAERTGKKVMYAFNVTGDLDQMRRRHEKVIDLEGTCIMASLNSVGLVGMIELGRFAEVPIHAHRNGWGYLSRCPTIGWSYTAWQKVWRLAGADHLHVNGLDSKFAEGNESVIASARTCLTPMFATKPCLAMPVFSSGQTVRQPAATYAALGSSDLIYAAGGAVMAHPDGPQAGVASLRDAWDAAMSGTPVDAYAVDHAPLARALDAFN
ncbi:MAG: ribulose-bisphosphate carboxylase large subunit family protein [Acidimicrobiia bacterium]|nr:MAG: ribulose-bisphosphate carboxylase large subunit family protein [Acidimicrobiia bacterium]